jgi:monomeric sarcosine oxidase
MATGNTFDVAVIGAGVFGAWTAWHLAKRKQRVVLLDAYGAANARASSAGESRIIRMGYGADEIYTRWSLHSLELWKDLFATTHQPLFHETGVLWLAGNDDKRLNQTHATLTHVGVPFQEMDHGVLVSAYPQVNFDGIKRGILEPHSGVLMARRAVAATVADSVARGVRYQIAKVETPNSSGNLAAIKTSAGETISAGDYVFACGSWLAKVFPYLLGNRIFPTRQEVFFFGVPAGDTRFAVNSLPTWLFQDEEFYGMPDIEERGLKIAWDHHGEAVDPDTQSRIVSPAMTEKTRQFAARRFPALHDAPIVETRVCQYENTSNGDFLIDRHPGIGNVWLVGGGSGHGFKHGPALGEYVAGQLLDSAKAEPRFSFATKATAQRRAVY